MAKNRELSQLGALVVVDDSNRNIGIATTATPSVGIGTTNPAYKLDVEGDIIVGLKFVLRVSVFLLVSLFKIMELQQGSPPH